MSTFFKDVDFEAVQLMYGFILCVLAILIATVMFGNIVMLTVVVAFLLLKDGIPNLSMGFVKLGAGGKKAREPAASKETGGP